MTNEYGLIRLYANESVCLDTRDAIKQKKVSSVLIIIEAPPKYI